MVGEFQAKKKTLTRGSARADGRTRLSVDFDKTICLRRARPFVPCEKCADACAASAISIRGDSVGVTVSCLGCGACGAVCPTGAIGASGFSEAPSTARRISIDCSRIETGRAQGDRWVVPCLRGLRVSMLIEAAEASVAQSTVFEIVDRGLCEACPAARGPAAHQTFARLREAFGSTGSHAIEVEYRRLPIDEGSTLPPGTQPPRSRRLFLRALIDADTARRPARGVLADRGALDRLAARATNGQSARVLPKATISEACRAHGICASACPTRALLREKDEGVHRLVFDGTRCIECGQCANVCPEKAMTISPARPTRVSAPISLRTSPLTICPKCEDAFAPSDEALCPACSKGNSLFEDLSLARQQRAAACRSSMYSDRSNEGEGLCPTTPADVTR